MQVRRARYLGVGVLVFGLGLGVAQAQLPSRLPQVDKSGGDPLAVGKAALERKDYEAAKKFFKDYLDGNAGDIEATSDLGDAELGLKDYPAAAKQFKEVIAAKKDLWHAHQDLVLAYAGMQDWADFDRERAVIKAARDQNAQGLAGHDGDVIDVLQVADKTYTVRAFYKLYGHYNTRYVFLHFGADGKLSDYIQCESDDIDQVSFKQAHPKEAAAGERSFSLDTYAISEKGSSQGLIKFYSDGEPTYETVRADALKVLEGNVKPAATTQAPPKP
jgi:tetratricopeptide (TPR) repeat protein